MVRLDLRDAENVALYYEIYDGLVRQSVKPARYVHIVNVGEMCRELAELHGYPRPDVARLAGIIHDVRKHADPALLLRETVSAAEIGLSPDPAEVAEPKLHHAVAGAYYCATVLKIGDEDIIRAVRYHTVGRAGMSLLEKIVYLSDAVSAERSYRDVEYYRELARTDIDRAMYEVLRFTAGRTSQRGGQIPLCAREALDFFGK